MEVTEIDPSYHNTVDIQAEYTPTLGGSSAILRVWGMNLNYTANIENV